MSSKIDPGTFDPKYGAWTHPGGKEVKAAKSDGRLPMEDHNTRIIVFGETGEAAREVAEALARNAFHNVSFWDADYPTLKAALHR